MNEIEQFIAKEYKENKSTYQICESLSSAGISGYYPNKINRILRKIGVHIRSKGEAQANSLATGRIKHPTKGTKRSTEIKLKIANSVHSSYKNNPEGKEKRSEISKERWKNMSDAQKNLLQRKAAKAVRESADEGSKLEKYIMYELRRAGYQVVFHSNSLIPKQSLQIDLYLPEIRTVIEVDGPSHFEAIWGDFAFSKMKKSDQEKNGLCLQYYNVIRLQALAKKVTGVYCRNTWARLLPKLEYIKENGSSLLPMENRLIFIEEK